MTSGNNQKKYPTIGSLFTQDLEGQDRSNQLYFLLCRPSSYGNPSYRFHNKRKYHLFVDTTGTPSLDYLYFMFPMRFIAAVGDEIPVLLDRQPGEEIKEHWRRWLPVFSPAMFKTIDEGLEDGVSVAGMGPWESIPDDKHYLEPKTHWWLQCKSVISKMGVLTPREMTRDDATFPCLLKVDSAAGGFGHHLAKCQSELDKAIREIAVDLNWDGKYIIQEFLKGPTFSYHMYLSKDGSITWLGAHRGGYEGFAWTSCIMNWREQKELQEEVFEELAIPIGQFLSGNSYSGLINFEVISTDHGRYVVDINLRVCGSTTFLLIAPYMADLGLSMSTNWATKRFSISEQELLHRAEGINEQGKGRVIIMAALDLHDGCDADVAVYGKTMDDVHKMCSELERVSDERRK